MLRLPRCGIGGRRKALAGFLILFLFIPSIGFCKEYLKVVFLDVGEGEAIYINMPSGENILIDTGNPATGYRVAEFLRKRGVTTITAIFITHPHPDHMGGVFHILPSFKVEAIYDNGQPIPEMPECDIYQWYHEFVRSGNYRSLRRGEVFFFGEVKVEVLWPEPPLSSQWNENSLVLKLTYGKVAFLLMGDATKGVERALLERDVDLEASVLKVGHHGSKDTLYEGFLKGVSPQYAVISINRGNIRGYPYGENLKLLKKHGVKLYTTYEHGNITFITDGDRIWKRYGS